MPLPAKLDQKIREATNKIFEEATTLAQTMTRNNKVVVRGLWGGESTYNLDKPHISESSFYELRTRFLAILQLMSRNNDYVLHLIDEVGAMENRISHAQQFIGIIQAFKTTYEAGLIDDLAEMVETEVVSDYMGQAEQLLGEGIAGQHDHVPAAVLTGAVLEDALRRLCQRQSPLIDTHKPDGSPKTLDPLIADLQKANVFNKAKADLLRSWAKTRNYAAHGEFREFTRSDVEAMIAGVKVFIADHL